MPPRKANHRKRVIAERAALCVDFGRIAFVTGLVEARIRQIVRVTSPPEPSPGLSPVDVRQIHRELRRARSLTPEALAWLDGQPGDRRRNGTSRWPTGPKMTGRDPPR